MYHALNVNWPCLSFDIFPDSLGQLRSKFPHTVYLAAGTQTGRDHYSANSVKIMKISDLHKTQHDEQDGASIAVCCLLFTELLLCCR
jgi:ribosome assembly protein RRB1